MPPPNPECESTSRRERKKQATRRDLHEAALTLVERHGLAGVTVEAITEMADVAPRTFFNYFSSKEEALINRSPSFVDEVMTALRARPAHETGFEALRSVLTDYFIDADEEAAHRLRRMRVVKSDPVLLGKLAVQFEQIEAGLTEAVAERLGLDPVADLEPSLVVSAGLAACRSALMHWCDQDGTQPVGTYVDQAFDRLAAGLASLPDRNLTAPITLATPATSEPAPLVVPSPSPSTGVPAVAGRR